MKSTNACKVDHFVLAAPDLQRACDDFEATTGVRPAFGGAHAGRGTHNALVAFENGSYLEIIAPDPAQQATSMSQPMALLARPTLMHWAVRCSGTAALSQRLRELGWTPTEIQRMSRTPPNAARLEWELFGLKDHRYGGLAPFFIDWFACPHPATTSPSVGPLTSVRLALPDPAPPANDDVRAGARRRSERNERRSGTRNRVRQQPRRSPLYGPLAGRVYAARLAGISAPISAPRRIFSTDLSRYTSHRHRRFSGMM